MDSNTAYRELHNSPTALSYISLDTITGRGRRGKGEGWGRGGGGGEEGKGEYLLDVVRSIHWITNFLPMEE